MRVLFFGTPAFAAKVLEDLVSRGEDVVGVISKPDKPQGRKLQLTPTPVKLKAIELNLPLLQPEKVSDAALIPVLESFNADLFVVVAYGEILKEHVLKMPKLGCINLHASLLPKYRGAAPIQRAIIDGATESGITIMHMVKKMDAGDMIAQVKVEINENMTYGELEKSLCEAGSSALYEVIQSFKSGIPPCQPQDETKVSFAPKIELEECQIDWEKPVKEIHNLVRGVNPEPSAWCFTKINGEQKRLKVFLSKAHPDKRAPVGEFSMTSDKKLIVGCVEGALELIEVQLEGKKRMSGVDFFRGIHST